MKVQNGDRLLPIVFPCYCTVLVCPASLDTLVQSLLKAKSTNSRTVKVLMPRSRPKYPPKVAKRKKSKIISLIFPASQHFCQPAGYRQSIHVSNRSFARSSVPEVSFFICYSSFKTVIQSPNKPQHTTVVQLL